MNLLASSVDRLKYLKVQCNLTFAVFLTLRLDLSGWLSIT